MSLGQAMVRAEADEITEPGENGVQFQNGMFPQEKAAASSWRERISPSSRFFFPEKVITLSPLTVKMPPRRKGTSPGGQHGFLQHNQEEGSLASCAIRKLIYLLLIYQHLNLLCSWVLCSTFVFRANRENSAMPSSNPCSPISLENGETSTMHQTKKLIWFAKSCFYFFNQIGTNWKLWHVLF